MLGMRSCFEGPPGIPTLGSNFSKCLLMAMTTCFLSAYKVTAENAEDSAHYTVLAVV